MANGKKERSPWVYIGCGCALLGGLAVLAMVVIGAMGVRSAKSWVEDLQDPLVRNQKARDMLGAPSLPGGYNALFYLEVPWVMEMVMLTDAEVPDNPEDFEELGDNSFIYINMRDFGNDREDMRDFLTGKTKNSRALENMDINFDFDMDNVLARGTLDIDQQHITYAVSQGRYHAQGQSGEGIFAMLLNECPEDERLRLAYWLRHLDEEEGESVTDTAEAATETTAEAIAEPEAIAEAEVGTTDGLLDPSLEGTPADRAALRRFLNNFDLCVN